ncbi:unnamed protein product [marine sediment metagenome]|uniref:Uncharacterized protein n=1 Tax=marine sediment metagenome TaxID=412755 RepID=X1DAS9_9ZZZZ
MNDLRSKLKISEEALKALNDFLLDKDNLIINDLFKIIDKHKGCRSPYRLKF